MNASASPVSSALAHYAPGAPETLQHFDERHDCCLEFNVMAGRPVTEVLHFRSYEVNQDYARGVFDRTYTSAMKASPSHLVFLTALVHLQKMM